MTPEVVGSIPAKTQKTDNSNLHGFASSKGANLLLQVIKAIINQSQHISTHFESATAYPTT